MKNWTRYWQPLLALILALLVCGTFYSSKFIIGNGIIIGIFALLALSVGMAYGHAGILSIATASFAAVGGYSSAILGLTFGISPYLTVWVSILIPFILAYGTAYLLLRLSPLPLSIATVVLSFFIEHIIREGEDYTGGYIGLSGVPTLPGIPGGVEYYLLTWGVVGLVMVIYINLQHSAIGRAANTARVDALRAIADGVSVKKVLAGYFGVTGAIAGLGGWLYVHYFTFIGPDSLNVDISLQVLLMALIGGVRSPLGAVLGAVILLVVGLNLPAAESEGMIYGGILVSVLLLAPDGLMSRRTMRWLSSLGNLKAKRRLVNR